MITIHQYLDKYKIPLESRQLIIGTIHPHNHEDFLTPFFYGNQNSIWKILSDVFPNELGPEITLNGILQFLQNRKIAVSDTIRECYRKFPTALDEDLEPKLLNWELIEQLKVSSVRHILFTSGFGKNNAFKLFYKDMIGLKITTEIRRQREVVLEPSILGRSILLSVLHSPSGTANRSLVRNKQYLAKKEEYQGLSRPVYQFKVDEYHQTFTKII